MVVLHVTGTVVAAAAVMATVVEISASVQSKEDSEGIIPKGGVVFNESSPFSTTTLPEILLLLLLLPILPLSTMTDVGIDAETSDIVLVVTVVVVLVLVIVVVVSTVVLLFS